jgi:hypothetical protein
MTRSGYCYTKTFGSRVADGFYETLLDGMELEELRLSTGIEVLHYLMIDAHFTWWVKGKSYLCRMVDMMHMGYVDEVLFGREVVRRLPELVSLGLALAGGCGPPSGDGHSDTVIPNTRLPQAGLGDERPAVSPWGTAGRAGPSRSSFCQEDGVFV